MKKALYKFYADCGRMGQLEGIFISTQEKVDKLIKSKIEVYFGEVLGKHSEIFGNIEKKEIEFITDIPKVIEIVERFDLTTGYNPFNYTSINFELEGENLDNMTIDEIIEKIIKNRRTK